MPIDIEFRRHSIKDGADPRTVGPSGCRLARAVGEQQLRGRGFTRLCASTYWRTHQTLAAFAEGAGDFRQAQVPEPAPIYLVSEEVRLIWRACRTAEILGKDMVEAAFAFDDELARRIASETAALCKEWVRGMPDGTRMLVVGHSPSLELMYFGLSGQRIPGLTECAGFRVVWDDQRTGMEFSHADTSLDPSGIRHSLGL